MNEKKIKRRLRILIVFSICITLFIFAAGIVGVRTCIIAFNQSTEESMNNEAENYKRRIQRQIQNNFQTLNTLASMIEVSELDKRPNFAEALEKIDAKNDFLLFGYFNLEGYGTFTHGGEQRYITLQEVASEIQKVVEENFHGKEAVSDAILGDLSLQTVFVYGVPVYRDGEVLGALIVSDSVDAFSKEVVDKMVIKNGGFMHLLDEDGNYIIRGKESAVKEDLPTIAEPPYMTEEEGQEVKERMRKGEVQEFTFHYENVKYHALLKPVEMNGWYLFCVNSLENVNQGVYAMVKTSVIIFVIIIALFFFTLFYLYREMRGNIRRLRGIAYYDELTGIHNFKYFKAFCEEAVKEQSHYAIVALNVRQFKFINEIFGNHQADKLLCFIGKTLENSILEGECACRESADYFYLFMLDEDREILENRLQKIIDQITKAGDIEKKGYRFSMHCGIAISEEGKNLQDIMTYAMFAMAKSKEVPQRLYWFFDNTLHEQERLNNYIENNAHKALKNEEFELYLQPKIDLDDDSLCGAEALVRWQEQNGNMLYPGVFIPLFEENGFCVELDMYMFEKVCKKLREWLDEGVAPINISINQSRLTFYKDNYIEDLCSILEKYKVSASYITLEILEGMFLKDVDEMTLRLKKLKEIGFRISMDDFGTGYSSLNMLGKLEIDEVKLDREFLKEALEEGNENTRLIMQEIIQLSHKLSTTVVVEGIETVQQDRFVKRIGCEYGQGYYYGRPIRANVFTKDFIHKI